MAPFASFVYTIHAQGIVLERQDPTGQGEFMRKTSITFFTITAEIHARSLANFYCQYADRHMDLKYMRRVSRQFDNLLS